jgi:hypothetical protein
MVAPPADAQGNRGNLNGVPGSISNLQAGIDAVRDDLADFLASLPDDLAGQRESLQSAIDALSDSLGDVAGDVSDLKGRVIALENAGGGAEGRIIWSGGCPNAVTTVSAVLYCTSGVDFDTAAGYVSTDGTGRFTIATPGLYRINFRGRMLGTQGTAWITVLPSAGGFYTAATALNRGTTQTRDVNLDVIWPFEANDVFELAVESDNQPIFPWAGQTPLGADSRLQVEYVGPLPASEELTPADGAI